MTDDRALVRCEGASRIFGRGESAVVALRDVTCELGPGQQIALVGRSGSGKSTLIHLMAGIDKPTKGVVEWPALGATTGPLLPGVVGVVFQGPSLIPPLTVAENVALPLVLAGESQAASALVAIATLAGLGLEALADRLPEEVSAGQAQRAGIARAIASRPRLLLADEPTGQLDQAAAHHVTRVLVGAARDLGAALLLSTHDEGVASTFSSRWEMVDGRLDTNASAWSR